MVDANCIINTMETRMPSDAQSAANCVSVPDAKQLIGFVQRKRYKRCHRSQDVSDSKKKKTNLFQDVKKRKRDKISFLLR